jgi:hypothetical protein
MAINRNQELGQSFYAVSLFLLIEVPSIPRIIFSRTTAQNEKGFFPATYRLST